MEEETRPWSERVLQKVAQLEKLEQESEPFVMGPMSVGLFLASCMGILAVGFQIGTKHQVQKLDKVEGMGARLLGDRVRGPLKPLDMIARGPIQPKVQLSAPAPALAMRALGYATVLTLSSATFICVTGTWYFQLTSVEDLIWRLKRNVPFFSKRIQGTVTPGLESIKTTMSSVFINLRPYIADPKKDNEEEREKERQALRDVGIDPSILDEVPKS